MTALLTYIDLTTLAWMTMHAAKLNSEIKE